MFARLADFREVSFPCSQGLRISAKAVCRVRKACGFPRRQFAAFARLADFREGSFPRSQGSRISAVLAGPRQCLLQSAGDLRELGEAETEAQQVLAQPIGVVGLRLLETGDREEGAAGFGEALRLPANAHDVGELHQIEVVDPGEGFVAEQRPQQVAVVFWRGLDRRARRRTRRLPASRSPPPLRRG